MISRILIVDDEDIIRNLCSDILSKSGFEITATGDPRAALKYALKETFDLIITDLKMPKMNGIEFMKAVKKEKPLIPFIFITGHGTYDMADEALREGAHGFINKPFRKEELEISVRNSIDKANIAHKLKMLQNYRSILEVNSRMALSNEKKQLAEIVLREIQEMTGARECAVFVVDELNQEMRKFLSVPEETKVTVRSLHKALEEGSMQPETLFFVDLKDGSGRKIGLLYFSKPEGIISRSDSEIGTILANQLGIFLEKISLQEQIMGMADDAEDFVLDTVRVIVGALDAKSPWTKGHSEKVAAYSLLTGAKLGLDKATLRLTELAAFLHDIGKIGTSDYLVEKPGKLLPEEYESVKKHPEKGVSMLLPVKGLCKVLDIVRHHHEWFDGRGYPTGISGEEIPLIARMISIADAYDSMTSERPYRKIFSTVNAYKELKRCAGSQFDPHIIDAFISSMDNVD